MGRLVRYADDLVVMCATRQQAEAALERLTVMLAELGLEPKAANTRIVHLTEGGEGFDFLGFHHRWVRARSQRHRHVCFLARWPSNKAVTHIRGRLRDLTNRRWLLLPVDVIVARINAVLRGWTGYFRFGNSTRQLEQIRNYALERLALLVAKRHQRDRAYGWKAVVYQSPNQLGLIQLSGTVVAPQTHDLAVTDPSNATRPVTEQVTEPVIETSQSDPGTPAE